MRKYILIVCLYALFAGGVQAQNPLIRNQYSADPSARVFGDRVYVYPSHDILATEGRGRVGWFCMEDYHVFSSANLTDWTDHGMIVQQNNVPWVKPNSYSMWAPDCIYRNGKYYFYFPSTPKDTSYARGFTVGVAIADKPEGPFVPQPAPILHVRGIDPNVFIDKDGQAYLYWSQGNIYAAKLKENMVELASDPVVLGELPNKGLKEGPYLFERNGTYYLTYPHVENKIERLEYATGNNPLGPFKVTGVIMDESPTGCWTNHHSIIQFKDQWYLFYHHNDYSPAFDKARSIRADSLFFNADGTIQKVTPTYRGIGVTKANAQIQLDRYTRLSDKGASIAFLDTASKFQGWKTVLETTGAWVQYNSVDFGKKKPGSVTVRVLAAAGGSLQIRVQGIDGPVLAEIPVTAGNDWQLTKVSLLHFKPGLQNLFVISKDNNQIAIDWTSFE
ncbi:alpha-N-arabinofuranosidase [Niastella koreensis]|uniref:Xylan 1,4-beta-xylosidase n=2 Tax=Niastella koreensis TaxID=354356 RepID=G8TM18_NIAKG|nr:family 43 glycosylhydrolase [Niastella koreensis]AEV98778.1 Xylan 1,4-beta-xylosidase [Niastella koreensis GR20-10]OQP43714.1 alpha-N-arabinofuranosidase [Niastella koreensis]